MTAAIVAAVVVLWVAAWPSRSVPATGFLDPGLQRRTIAGAFHVHSTLSDGSGTRSEIAAAAARAGLQFVVFTDHGDGTRQPEPPSYASGVLCIDAVEISTNTGHYIALGLGTAPYRLGGEASAVVEDVRRLGGFGIVAHPDSPRPALAWRDWTADADGVEWLNADSEWRNESWPSLGRTLLGYLARPAPALASMLDRESVTIDRWDGVTSRRRMAAFAALDAHGGPGRSKEEAGHLGLPRLPSYEAAFSSFSMRAIVRTPLSGSAAADAPALLEALRAGRTYTTLDGVASPALARFQGRARRPHGTDGRAPPRRGTCEAHGAVVRGRSKHLADPPEWPSRGRGSRWGSHDDDGGRGGLPGRGSVGRQRLARSLDLQQSYLRRPSCARAARGSARGRRGRGSRARRVAWGARQLFDRGPGRRRRSARVGIRVGFEVGQPVRRARRAAASARACVRRLGRRHRFRGASTNLRSVPIC